jgi:hypothetical protein
MQFTTEQEKNNSINTLDITIKKDRNGFKFDIYRKPTATDIIIPHESCHPIEQKLSAIHYLQNRKETYPTDEHSKQKEEHVIDHTLHNNNYNTIPLNRQKTNHKKKDENLQPQRPKWAKFTYVGRKTRFITKLFKNSGINIAFTTKLNIGKLLTYTQDNHHNKYDESGVYQLTCLDCNRKYIGQTGRSFHIVTIWSRFMFCSLRRFMSPIQSIPKR